MLTVKISELGAINSLSDPDLLPVVDTSDSTTKKVTAAQIRDFLLETLAPASIVVSQTTFGIEPAVGTSLGYAREDHTHGTPPDPMPDHLAALDPHNSYLLANGARALTNTFNAGAQRITALASPLTTTDAVNKAYVDSKVQGLDWQESVKSQTNDPPATPIAIGRYLVNTAPTGDWAGHANSIATWNGVTWGFETPNDGWATWIEDADILRVFNGTAWVTFGSTMDHGALSGLLDDDHPQYLLADGTRDLGGSLTVVAIGPPSVSPESKGRIYFDSESLRFRVSENSSDYVDLVTGGTVTSVDLSTNLSGIEVGGNPITGAGTLTLNGILGAASGGTGATTLTGYVYGNGTDAFTANTSIPGSDVSGDISGNATNVTGVVAIANGGTGQTTAAAAFGELSPLTTKGDLLGYGPANARIPVGDEGQVLTADPLQDTGVRWATPTTGTVTGTGSDNQIAVWSGASSLEGDGSLTWSGTELGIAGALTKIGGAFSLSADAPSDLTVTAGRLAVTGNSGLELRTSELSIGDPPRLIEGYADLVFGGNSFVEGLGALNMTATSITVLAENFGRVGALLVVELADVVDGVPVEPVVAVSGVVNGVSYDSEAGAVTLTVDTAFENTGPVYRYRVYNAISRVRNIAEPLYPADAATKEYVDNYVPTQVTTTNIGYMGGGGTGERFSIDAAAGTILADASEGNLILVLPDATTCNGRQYVIKKIDASAYKVIIGAYGYGDPDVADQYIDGTTFYELRNQYEAVKVQSNGTQFWII